MDLAFVLLGAAIAAAWLPPLRVRGVAVPAWAVLFVAAAVAGARAGVLAPVGVAALALLCAFAAAACFAPRGRGVFTLVAAAWALALALHVVPGFHNPKLFDGVRFGADSLPFTTYLNFDKAAAGLWLLVAFCRPDARALAGHALARTLVAAIAVPAVVIGVAMLAGYTRLEPKWPDGAAVFLCTNLLFACVAEEAFFRGLIQERIARLADRDGRAAWKWVAVGVSAALFTLAHVGGDATAMLVIGLAGLGYSLTYALTRRIEAAILVHFALNAAHFVGFAYPALVR